MPKNVAERRTRCLEIRARTSPTASPHASDEEADDPLDKKMPGAVLPGAGDMPAAKDSDNGAGGGTTELGEGGWV